MSPRRFHGPCPYCFETDPVYFRGREHVIPQSLGKFRNSHDLIARAVCDRCNDHFSQTLDRHLARDSFITPARYQHGPKNLSEFNASPARLGMKLRVDAANDPLDGVGLELFPHEGRICLRPRRMVGFRAAETDPWDYYPHDALPSADELIRKHNTRDLFARAVGFADENLDLPQMLGYLGGTASEVTEDHSIVGVRNVRTELVVRASRELLRAVAKIAFNYLIASSPGVARLPNFSCVRQLVRDDVGIAADLVRPIAFVPDVPHARAAHRLAVDATHAGHLFATVTLFGVASFQVQLSSYPLVVVGVDALCARHILSLATLEAGKVEYA